MQLIRAVILVPFLIYGSLAHSMEKALLNSQARPHVSSQESPNAWMVGTYLALLPADLHGPLKEILAHEPAVFGCAIEANPPLTLGGHKGYVYSAQFSVAGDKVVTASIDSTAKIWKTKDGTLIATLTGHNRELFSFAQFNRSGDKIVTASFDGTAMLWNVDDGSLRATLSGHSSRVCSAEFNAAGDKVVTASYDGSARIWNGEDGSLRAILVGHTGRLNSAHFNVVGDKIVTASDDRTAKVWKVDGTLEATLIGHDDRVCSAEFNATGDKIVTSSYDRTAKVWKVDGTLEATLISSNGGVITLAHFNRTGEQIVTTTGRTGELRIYGKHGLPRVNFIGHSGDRGDIKTAQFNAAGDKIVTASYDETAKIWHVKDGSLIATLDLHDTTEKPPNSAAAYQYSAQFNEAGDFLVGVYGSVAKIWKQPALSLKQLVILYGAANLLQSSREKIFNAAKELSKRRKINLVDAVIEILEGKADNEASKASVQNTPPSNCSMQ